MKISLDSQNVKRQLDDLDEIMNRRKMRAMVDYLQGIRKTAAKEFLIPNQARDKKGRKIKNPKWARKVQPSLPDVLTNRTEKLYYSLLEKSDEDFYKFYYKRTPKQIFLKTAQTDIRVNSTMKKLTGSITNAKNYLTKYTMLRARGMPLETLTTMYMRYMWELGRSGIRGQKRLFLRPAANKIWKSFVEDIADVGANI